MAGSVRRTQPLVSAAVVSPRLLARFGAVLDWAQAPGGSCTASAAKITPARTGRTAHRRQAEAIILILFIAIFTSEQDVPHRRQVSVNAKKRFQSPA